MKSIAVIGVGYVGLVSGACFADLGNHVICLDINAERIANLKQNILPIYEPGLEELVERNVKAGRLSFTTSYAEAIQEAEFVFIAVGTPSDVDGQADLRYVRMAAESIADVMDHPLIIVNKSTVPVGTGDWVAEIIHNRRPDAPEFAVVSCPEFLREGSAISDFMNPDRTVLGSTNKDAAAKVAQLHLPLRSAIMITDLRTAEMIKYASNAFLATKISFINEIANICEALGADVKEVAAGMGLDKRIGRFFLDAGIGWGGSCFPKDVKALAYMAETEGRHPHLLHAVMDINADQRQAPVRKLREIFAEDLKGKVIGLLGLAFKPNTDDMRDAPSIDIVHSLLRAGAKVRAYDPVAMPGASALLPDVEMMPDPYALAEGADALILVTEWNEFKHLDLARIKTALCAPVLIDGRNIYDPQTMAALGFIYRGIGRGYNGEGVSESAC
ncbi:MAG TPA: UDP-glucose/GDP-mannose dehydrogenase family protein [Anaerolineae bacterium]|nr:UDP-glucose/GDP-mannose dehydrogenase family protein [Anaerolineae bacterium]HXK43704.1 UDP-glucose/GDP-mannose dehydrogenase family protein [Anaerolineae bacterium]